MAGAPTRSGLNLGSEPLTTYDATTASEIDMTILTTARLRLEPFDDAHLDGLNAINSDPEVVRYLTGRPETREETIAVVERVKARWAEYGFSWWTFIERASGEIVGAGCIQHLRKSSAAPDPTCPLEVGWRLRRDRWHQGLATEAAVAMTDFAFHTLRAEVLYAVCRPENTASALVMKRLGMRYRGIELWYDAEMASYEITVNEWQNRASRPVA
jgi:RimJ/RimL family protein N-acetyltransferase